MKSKNLKSVWAFDNGELKGDDDVRFMPIPMSEKLIEKKLREAVSKLGGLALKLSSFSFTGLPDRMVLMPGGRIFFAEIKTTGKKPKPRQKLVGGTLRKLGFTVDVIDDETTLNNFLNKLK